MDTKERVRRFTGSWTTTGSLVPSVNECRHQASAFAAALFIRSVAEVELAQLRNRICKGESYRLEAV